MSVLIVETTCSAAARAERRRPRVDIVEEQPAGPDRWELAHGPFRHYERTLEAAPTEGDRWRVTERTEYRLAIPVWGWLFHLPVRRALRLSLIHISEPTRLQ